MMGRDLNELASYFLPQFQGFLDDCAAAGVPVRVIDTGRTPAEQETKIAQGVSWTTNSKHEPQPPEGKSEAGDAVPEAILEEQKADWDPTNPLWLKIGEIGEARGMEWGGRWKTHPDPSHFQYIHRTPTQILTDTELSTT
jgi:peptidoglycan LD-endopeptidase CwlK